MISSFLLCPPVQCFNFFSFTVSLVGRNAVIFSFRFSKTSSPTALFAAHSDLPSPVWSVSGLALSPLYPTCENFLSQPQFSSYRGPGLPAPLLWPRTGLRFRIPPLPPLARTPVAVPHWQPLSAFSSALLMFFWSRRLLLSGASPFLFSFNSARTEPGQKFSSAFALVSVFPPLHAKRILVLCPCSGGIGPFADRTPDQP